MSFEVVNLDALRQIGSDHNRNDPERRRRSDDQDQEPSHEQVRRGEDGGESVPESVRSSGSSGATPITGVEILGTGRSGSEAVSVVSSVGSFAPTLANNKAKLDDEEEGDGTLAQARMMVDISQPDDNQEAGDISTVGSFAPTLANNKEGACSTTAAGSGSNNKEGSTTAGSSSNKVSEADTDDTVAHAVSMVDTSKDDQVDCSTVGSFAPTLANRQGSSIAGGGGTVTHAMSIVDTTRDSSDDDEVDMSTVGSFAPTLANHPRNKDANDDDDIPIKTITNSSGHTRRDVDVVIHKGDKDDGMSSVGSFAPTTADTRTAATCQTSKTDQVVKVVHDDDMSSVGNTAPTLSSSRKTLRDSLISTTSSDDCHDTYYDDVSSVGNTAPTLSTKRTNPTLRNSLISTSSTDDDNTTDGDLSSLGMSRTPTLSAADQRSVAASVRNAVSVVGLETSNTNEDCSTIGSFAPTLSGINNENKTTTKMSEDSGRTTNRARASTSKVATKPKPTTKTHQSRNYVDHDLYSDGLTFDHYASDMAYLGGVLGRDDLKSGLEDVVGTFLRQGAMVGMGIFITLLIVALAAAPFSSYQYLNASEQIANATLLALMVSVNLNRLGPILINDKKCNWNFLSSGAMTAAVTIQFMSISAAALMLVFPTPVMVDPIMGTRCHLVRWVEWAAVAFVMCFLTESIDLPLEDASAKRAWFTAISVAISSACGGIFPFCQTKETWWIVFAAAVIFFIPLYVRLAWRGFRLLRLPKAVTTSDKEDNERARYAFKLMVVCTTVWTYLVVAWIVVTLKHANAEPGSFWANDWLILANENICEALSKIGYLSILLEVHEVLFDDVSKTARRLGELRSYMSAVWDNSSDVVIICSRHDYLVNAAVSPAIFQMETGFGYHQGKSSKKNNNNPSNLKQDQTTLIMEIDPYESSHRTYEMDLSKPMTRQEANTMMKNSRNKARMVTPVFEKNLKVLGDLVSDSCTLPIPNGENQYTVRKQFYCLDKDRNEEILTCDAKVVKLKGKTFLILLRDVTQRG